MKKYFALLLLLVVAAVPAIAGAQTTIFQGSAQVLGPSSGSQVYNAQGYAPYLYSSGVTPGSSQQNLASVIDLIVYYLKLASGLLMAVAVVMFVFYAVKYFVLPDQSKAEAGKHVMWSVIGFFVILSFWGLVYILQNTFGLTYSNQSWSSFMTIFPR